ncbi:mechanosensitive ion channel family protein [Poriferisphaera sp. WC338]|uniref:mechanosensitive ion channel family protein n=1 Tax=Poriferisphaera sp. WC338 TaxID=3425129 RepID=UPI003D813D5E
MTREKSKLIGNVLIWTAAVIFALGFVRQIMGADEANTSGTGKSVVSVEATADSAATEHTQAKEVGQQIAGADETVAQAKSVLSASEVDELADADPPRVKDIFKWEMWEKLFRKIWLTPIYRSGTNEISLYHMVIALIAAVVGYWLSKRISMLVYRRIKTVKKVSPTAALLTQKIIFYVLAIFVTLVALQFMGIPITMFTVLGGALAIGLSFGAQNVIANFLSGIIIMAERPIRLGDTIVLESGGGMMEGVIDDIGQRSTRVKRIDGVDVIVPNGQFVNEAVTNWTLSDDIIRSCVKVGVAYGTNVIKVRELLKEAVDGQAKVLRKPEPIVVFDEFGDNALNFEVYYWANLATPMQRKMLQSDIRFAVDILFEKAGIVIAYPQRDVHLDSVRPLEVRMVDSE